MGEQGELKDYLKPKDQSATSNCKSGLVKVILLSRHDGFSPYTLRWLTFNIRNVHPEPLHHLFADLAASSYIDRV